jgi:hypothetical protein
MIKLAKHFQMKGFYAKLISALMMDVLILFNWTIEVLINSPMHGHSFSTKDGSAIASTRTIPTPNQAPIFLALSEFLDLFFNVTLNNYSFINRIDALVPSLPVSGAHALLNNSRITFFDSTNFHRGPL